MSWRYLGGVLLSAVLVVSVQAHAQDEPLQAKAAVQSQQVYVG